MDSPAGLQGPGEQQALEEEQGRTPPGGQVAWALIRSHPLPSCDLGQGPWPLCACNTGLLGDEMS